jgi:hypothetical protein
MSGRQDWYLVFKNAKVKPDQSTCVIGSFTLLPEFPEKIELILVKEKRFLSTHQCQHRKYPCDAGFAKRVYSSNTGLGAG